MEKTPWFPSDMKPSREGSYETRIYPGELDTFQYWTGRYWSHSETTPYRAQMAVIWPEPGVFQNVEWRGLTEKPQ